MTSLFHIDKISKICAFLLGAMAIAALAIIISSIFLGCSYWEDISGHRREFWKNNPNTPIIAVDEDNDGAPDYDSPDKDRDGEPDKDSNGKPIKLPNSEENYRRSKLVDEGLSEISLLIAAFGVPGFGLVSTYLKKRKIFTQLTTLISSIELAKEENSTEGYITLSKKALDTLLKEKPELITLIEKIQADIAKNKS